MSRRRTLRFKIAGFVLAIVVIIRVGSLFIAPDATGIAIGVRRSDLKTDVVCGVYLDCGDVWYSPYIVPEPFDPITGAQTLQHGDYQWDSALGFRLIPYFATNKDWYYAAGAPFWVVFIVCGI